MSDELALVDNPLEAVAHALCDISAALGEIWHDLQAIKGQLVLRQDVEYRLEALENLVHAALMSELGEGDTDESSPF